MQWIKENEEFASLRDDYGSPIAYVSKAISQLPWATDEWICKMGSQFRRPGYIMLNVSYSIDDAISTMNSLLLKQCESIISDMETIRDGLKGELNALGKSE